MSAKARIYEFMGSAPGDWDLGSIKVFLAWSGSFVCANKGEEARSQVEALPRGFFWNQGSAAALRAFA